MDNGMASVNKELMAQEMFAAAARGQVHAGGAAIAGAQQATASGLGDAKGDSVEISPLGLQLAASAQSNTE